MKPLYASAVVVVWGLVALRGGSLTRFILRLAVLLRACAIYGVSVAEAIWRDHAALWMWAKVKAREEVQ